MKKMGNVFWFTGMSGTGKSTLAKKLEEQLEKDFSVELFEGAKIETCLGVFEFRRRKVPVYIKKIANMALESSKKNDIVLVVISCSRQKFQNIAREILGPKYNEIYIKCSEKSREKRMTQRRLGKIFSFRKLCLRIFYGSKTIHKYNPYNFEPPEFPDLEIDNENVSIDESVKLTANLIHKKIPAVNKK